MANRLRTWFDRFGAAWVVVALVEVILISFVLWGIWRYREATVDRGDSRVILSAIDVPIVALLDAETGERGYVITGDQSFLGPYEENSQLALDSLAHLADLVSGDEGQSALVAEATETAEARVANLAYVVDLVDAGNVAEASAFIAEGEGVEQMEQIRATLALVREEEEQRLDSRLKRENRTVFLLAVTAISLAVVTLGIVAWLLTSVRREQKAKVDRAASAAKDEFVGFVSHELRTPIAIVAGNARLLEDPDGLDQAERANAVEEIAAAAERLDSIVATLLSLAKAEAGGELELEPVQVHRIAASAARLHRSRFPGRAVDLVIPEGLPPAMGNQDALEQVFVNLLSNAERYGAPLAPITVEVGERDDGIVTCVSNVAPPDTPVTRAQLEQVFEPFFRSPSTATSTEGIGLGLTICHRLVVAQGGRMGARIRPDGAVEFSFILTCARLDGAEV